MERSTSCHNAWWTRKTWWITGRQNFWQGSGRTCRLVLKCRNLQHIIQPLKPFKSGNQVDIYRFNCARDTQQRSVRTMSTDQIEYAQKMVLPVVRQRESPAVRGEVFHLGDQCRGLWPCNWRDTNVSWPTWWKSSSGHAHARLKNKKWNEKSGNHRKSRLSNPRWMPNSISKGLGLLCQQVNQDNFNDTFQSMCGF